MLEERVFLPLLSQLRKRVKMRLPVGLLPNPKESFNVTRVNVSKLQQLKVVLIGKGPLKRSAHPC